ncbi:MAG: hypothetical protein ABIP48_16525 [Planctomycetota bacterium]
MAKHFTIGDVARIYNEPEWKIRRIVDALNREVPRAGQYRLIPHDMLPAIGVELERRAQANDARGGDSR